jgi:hypothetical protein
MGLLREPYTCIYRGIWHDVKFRRRSELGQRVYLYLLSSPLGNGLGCYRASRAAMAADLHMGGERFAEGFAEGFDPRLGDPLYSYDEEAEVVYLPAYLRRNPPTNPNAVRALGRTFVCVPDCAAKLACYLEVEAYVAERGGDFGRAFGEAFQRPDVQAATETGSSLPLPHLGGTFEQRSPNVDGTLTEPSNNVRQTLAERSPNVDPNIAATFAQRSPNVRPTFAQHSPNVSRSLSLSPSLSLSQSALRSDARAPEDTNMEHTNGRWVPDDPRGRENGWPWKDLPTDRMEVVNGLSEQRIKSWTVRLQWYWPDLPAQDAAEIAVQTLRLYGDQGVDVRAELAKAAGARPRRDGCAGLRGFLAKWMGIAQRDLSRGRPATTERPRPLPPPASVVSPPDPVRTPEEEAAIADARKQFFATVHARPPLDGDADVPAPPPPCDGMTAEQRAQFEAMGRRARERAVALDGPPAVAAGSLAAAALGEGGAPS